MMPYSMLLLMFNCFLCLSGCLFFSDVLVSEILFCSLSCSSSLLGIGSSLDSSLSIGSSLQLGSVLCDDLYGDLYSYLLVEVNESYIVANLLGILHGDDLAINILTQLGELVGYLSSAY